MKPSFFSCRWLDVRPFILFALFFSVLTSARATNGTWVGTAGDGAWTTLSNWSNGSGGSIAGVPTTGNTATFNGAGNGFTTITTGTVSAANITFDTSSAAAYVLGGASAGTGQINITGTVDVTSTVTNNEKINANLFSAAAGSTMTLQNDSTAVTLTQAGQVRNITGSSGTHTLIVTGVGTTIVSGQVTDNGGSGALMALTKNGNGTLTLSSAINSYTGATTINAGTLNLTGVIGSGSAVALNGGTLAGTGTVNGALTTASGAHLSPGSTAATAGTLHFGSAGVNLVAGTNLDFDLASLASGTSDLISMGGTLTIGNALTFNINELTAGNLQAGANYTLISGFTNGVALSGTLGSTTFTTTGASGYNASYSIVGSALDVSFTLATPAAAFYNGQGTDLNTAGNYDTTVSGGAGSVATALPAGTTNLSFSANRNALTNPNLSAPLSVNSVTFGAGSGTNTGLTVSASGTGSLTILAGSSNGNTSGNGITVNSGSDTISAPVILGASQAWTTASGTSLTVSGAVSGSTFSLTKAGTGSVTLSSSTGNSYTGGTVVNAGTLFVNSGVSGTSSGTGSGAVTVNSGGTLAGSGNIATSGGVAVNSGGSIASGAVQSGTSVTGTGLTFTNTSVAISSANLTFDLGAGTTAGAGFHTFGTPNTNTTFLTLAGSTSINFTGSVSISLVDLTTGSLALRQGTPYLLIDGTSDSQYTGLVTVVGTGASAVYSLDGDGYVVGVYNGSGALSTNYTPITINQFGPDGTTALSGGNIYASPVLYLNGGDLEVVPEPGTWALMLGGLMTLFVVIQRRKGNLNDERSRPTTKTKSNLINS